MSDLAPIPAPGKGRAGCIHTSLQAYTLPDPVWVFHLPPHPRVVPAQAEGHSDQRAISALGKGAEGREQTLHMQDRSGALKTMHCPCSHRRGRGQRS